MRGIVFDNRVPVAQGMGEPMHNLDAVLTAVDTLVHPQGLHFSPAKVTVSTSGLLPQMRRFCRESSACLALSLNATTNEVIDGTGGRPRRGAGS